MGSFEVGALALIVPFAIACLCGCACICRHKMELWKMRKDDPEAPAVPQPKIVVPTGKTPRLDVDKYEAPSDSDAGNRTESESESILESGKARKSFCA